MKKSMVVTGVVLLTAWADLVFAQDVWVNPYQTQDGGYVQGHHRSAPDSNPYNNYSTQGNVNPYTGQVGHENPNGHDHSNGYGNYGNSAPNGHNNGTGW
ncbi:MAG: hypothetical protein NTZ16_16300 [Verrucomicrobia bacterium]|nr:hypothetical protein [Verrucomicrobiota bacterium]